MTPPAGEVERLTAKVRELEHQLELERVINRERERTIEAQQLALRAIERVPSPTEQPTQEVPSSPENSTPERESSTRRGWRTLFGR